MELIAELTPIRRTSDDSEWRPRVYGASRNDGTWAAWLEFAPLRGDGTILATGMESTQPNRDAVAYWASGLETVYLEGALARANDAPVRPAIATELAPPVLQLEPIDLFVLGFLRRERAPRVAAWRLFATQLYANADLVRSLERLEQTHRLLIRTTDAGTEWIELTQHGTETLDSAPLPVTSEARLQR